MKMKVGIVSPYDYHRFGGVQEHIKAVADELSSRGHDVRILAPTPEVIPEELDERVIHLGASKQVSTPLATSAEIAVSAGPKEIDKVLDDEKFDILHFHEPWVPVLSKQILNRSNTINVGTFHAKLPENILNKSIEKAWLPYARSVTKKLQYITVVSTAASDYINTVTKKPLNIIPNGIDLSDYNASKYSPYQDFNDDVSTILYVGRLEKRKGVEYLLRAYKELLQHYNNVRLVIVGDGPKRKTLQNYIEKNKLPNISFMGFVDDKEKKELLLAADVFCSPALYGESFGIVLLEAMAMSIPIVAGNNPGYSSVMQQTGRLSLVDPKDSTEFAQRLELLLTDKAIREAFIEWSEVYVKQFDYKIITDEYEQTFEDLIRTHG